MKSDDRHKHNSAVEAALELCRRYFDIARTETNNVARLAYYRNAYDQARALRRALLALSEFPPEPDSPAPGRTRESC